MDITVKNLYIKATPRKVRPLLHGLKGANCEKSLEKLMFVSKKGGKSIYKLVKSAMAAAKENDLEINNLYIKEIFCNEGPRLKRRRMESKGVSRRITKSSAHLVLTISDEAELSQKAKVESQKEEEVTSQESSQTEVSRSGIQKK
ncbi:MAG: uL22 family ribosomal protein [Patescibacteria group bacterium]